MSLVDHPLLLSAMERAKDSLIESQRSKGLRASGYSADSLSLKTEASGTLTTSGLYGTAYWRQQQFGRGPGRYPKPSRAMVKSIEEWLRIRGLNYSAYGVAYKINRDGIQVPNRHNPGGVLDVLKPETVKQLISPILLPSVREAAAAILFDR